MDGSGMSKITRPYSKLNRLCQEAAARGGSLTTFAAVAKQVDLSAGRITQLFGYGQEADGITVNAKTVGLVVSAFRKDGIACEIDWLYLDFDDFAARIAAAPSSQPDDFFSSSDWELREDTVLADLVELRLHPPRSGNEVKNSYYVDATLLFGTAVCDYEPEDGQEPRSISIALRDAKLAIGSDSFRPLQGSMIGERLESKNFRRVAGGIEITGPAPAGTLDGDPIGGHHLAVLVATNADDGPFAVTVAAGRRSFVVVDVSEDRAAAAPADNKTVILNQFIYRRCTKDDAGRAVLAEATMTRRAGNEDDPEA
jgi:hypothetical protein